jgi:type II secretory ATPase GspE/PulE/Tfp pilus assembly ATPase PilB-like protein
MIDNKSFSSSFSSLIAQASKKKLGEMLVEQKIITQKQLDSVLAIQSKEGGRLGQILVKEKIVNVHDLLSVLSIQYNVPVIDLKKKIIQSRAIELIPEEIARKSPLIPVEVVEDSLVVAMAYPDDVVILRDISTRTGKNIRIVLAGATDIISAIDLNYKAGSEIESSLKQVSLLSKLKEDTTLELTADTPIAQSLYLILRQAVRDRASDVHIEPQPDKVRIRFRIDGGLHDMYSLPISVHSALISRIKILGSMNIAEQRRPQDGQFSIEVNKKDIDIRVATMATAHGERAALRILDRTLTPLSLEEIGFLPEQLERYRKILKSPFGVVLVGGPTGSGKTTTLYASLNQFDANSQNIITVEDPIEYKFENINQTQINTKADITFASGLRSILRHDPDIVLVGEVRDKETATIVIQAALTGRLVLATIHANDAISVLFRLIDLGIEPYIISPTLVATVSQRMVRRICPHCKDQTKILPLEEAAYIRELGEKPQVMYKGKGCNMCANTGFRGRVALVELLTMSENLRHLVLSGAGTDEIKATALKEGMTTMQRDGMLKAKQGITTIGEVLRSTFSGYW